MSVIGALQVNDRLTQHESFNSGSQAQPATPAPELMLAPRS